MTCRRQIHSTLPPPFLSLSLFGPCPTDNNGDKEGEGGDTTTAQLVHEVSDQPRESAVVLKCPGLAV